MSGNKWGHDPLAHDLAEHLRHNGSRMVWENMQMGPSGSARPDVYTMNKSFSNPRPLVYEVKVSVADFRSDITSGKWQKYLDFSCGVIFAVPKGLVKKDEIPKGCGLIIRSDAVWRTVKGPTMERCELQQNHLLKLLIDGVDRQVQRMNIRRVDDWCSGVLERAGLAQDVAAAVQDLRQVQSKVEKSKQHASKIISDAKEKAASILEREESAIKSIHAQLCNTLDIDPNGFRNDLPNLADNFDAMVKNLLHNLSSGAEVKRLQTIIDSIDNSIARAGDLPSPQKYWHGG